MPFYEYQCTDCNDKIEVSQTYDKMNEVKDSLRCRLCEGRMRFVFPAPNLSTDTTFVSGWGDGFGDRESAHRNQAKQAAVAAGVSTMGATYCPGLCARGKPRDPAAWVPHDNAKGYIKKRCEDLNLNCEDFGITAREPLTDPADKPYEVAPDLVDQEVARVIDHEHDGVVDPKKLPDLMESAAERLAGDQT